VLRFWEHEPSADCAARIATEVEKRRAVRHEAQEKS